jgi:hypothetical protein
MTDPDFAWDHPQARAPAAGKGTPGETAGRRIKTFANQPRPTVSAEPGVPQILVMPVSGGPITGQNSSTVPFTERRRAKMIT